VANERRVALSSVGRRQPGGVSDTGAEAASACRMRRVPGVAHLPQAAP